MSAVQVGKASESISELSDRSESRAERGMEWIRMQIPPNPLFSKGGTGCYPPLAKGGTGDLLRYAEQSCHG